MNSKKEAKAAYKEMKFPMGVFQIRSTLSGKTWLEASVNMPALWNRLKFQLDLGAHPDKELQAEWKLFGAEAFVYEVVAELAHEETEVPRNLREEVEALLELCRDERRNAAIQ